MVFALTQELYGLDKMKKHGHHVKCVKGQQIVIMPAKRGTPGKLQESWADTTEKDELLEQTGGER